MKGLVDIKDIIEKYTLERYLTRSETLFRTYTNNIGKFDALWQDILTIRKTKGYTVSIKDQNGDDFWYMIPPFVEKLIHHVNFIAKHHLEEIATKELCKELLIENFMIDEAFYSSVIEGAFSTKKRTKELVKSGNPRDKSEQMILNNYNALTFVLENLHKELNEELFLQIYKIITEKALTEEDITDKYRNDQVYVMDPNKSEPIYVPPKAENVQEMMDNLFNFIKEDDSKYFINPIIKAFIIHFYIGYVHPFFDGNGRVARAFTYMYLLKQNYDFFKFFSISSVINKNRSKYYKAFKDTEENESDITYFIVANAEIAEKSINEVIEKLLNELDNQLLKENLNKDGIFLNKRQNNLVRYMAKKETTFSTIEIYKNRFKVSYETARKDLAELEQLGVFKKVKRGKKYIYVYQGFKGYIT